VGQIVATVDLIAHRDWTNLLQLQAKACCRHAVQPWLAHIACRLRLPPSAQMADDREYVFATSLLV